VSVPIFGREQMHKNRKSLITAHLSNPVLDGTGFLMVHESPNPGGPVLWLNRDIIARQLNQMCS
jgi:hypothetical protein